ncbi:methyltransferase-like protein 17, mitochondrial isoform X2 [Ooceraea biroi]|nr:methyltransferase-like protein 17, mitochondrial isoform X2 [Ooceraea biroi]
MEPIVSRMYRARFISLRRFSAKSKVVLDETTSTLFSNDEMKYRHHEGIIKPRTPDFPEWASKEIRDILKEKHVLLKDIKASAINLNRYLHNRRPPVEDHQLPEKLQKVEECLNERVTDNDQKISIEDIDFRTNRKARNILKQNVYNWQPIKFDKPTSLTYLVARSVQNYVVLYKILNEIKQRDKNFTPKTLFDFGSGFGTVMWAASEIWSNSIKEYFCVDVSEAMIELSERLAKAAKPQIAGISYRQYFPASMQPTYDIVVSAYSLFEMPGEMARLEAILKLWRKTENYLIIVEEGTNAGFKLVNEARDFVLKYANSKYKTDRQPSYVFSPCPHDFKCPRFVGNDVPCSLVVRYYPLKFLDATEHKSELYSYVVLKKSKRPEDDKQWPRLVEHTLKRHRHVICRMCVASGELKEEIFTKSKHGKHMYRCAKSTMWGDRLPLSYEQQQENPEEENPEDGTANERTSNTE